eukprot:s755_g2.t1
MKDVQWAAFHGIVENPEWYPELRTGAPLKDFALVLYMHGQPGCPRPCDEGEPVGHFVPYQPEADPEDEDEAEESKARRRKENQKKSDEEDDQDVDLEDDEDQSSKKEKKQIVRLAKLLRTQEDRKVVKTVQSQDDNCARPGLLYAPAMAGSFQKSVKSSNECRMHCRRIDGAGHFLFYASLGLCHCAVYGATKQEVPDVNNLAGPVNCGVQWEKVNKDVLSGCKGSNSSRFVNLRPDMPQARTSLSQTVAATILPLGGHEPLKGGSRKRVNYMLTSTDTTASRSQSNNAESSRQDVSHYRRQSSLDEKKRQQRQSQRELSRLSELEELEWQRQQQRQEQQNRADLHRERTQQEGQQLRVKEREIQQIHKLLRASSMRTSTYSTTSEKADSSLKRESTADLSEPITSQQMKSEDIMARSPSKSQRVGWQSKPCFSMLSMSPDDDYDDAPSPPRAPQEDVLSVVDEPEESPEPSEQSVGSARISDALRDDEATLEMAIRPEDSRTEASPRLPSNKDLQSNSMGSSKQNQSPAGDECWYPSELAAMVITNPDAQIEDLGALKSRHSVRQSQLNPSSGTEVGEQNRRSVVTEVETESALPLSLSGKPVAHSESESSRRSSQLQAVPHEAEAFESSRRASQLQTVPHEAEEPTSSRRASQPQAVPFDPRGDGSTRRASQTPSVSFEQGENVWEARHHTENSENKSSSKAAEKETSRRRAGRKTLDSCAVLGASPEDDLTTIRTQYRRVALSHHPDKGGSKQAFVRLQGAKDYMLARNAVEHTEGEILKKHTSSFRHAASMQFAAESSDSEDQGRSEDMPEQTGCPVRSPVDLTRLEMRVPMSSTDKLQEHTSSRRASQLQAVPYEPREAESSRRVSQLQAVPHASEDRRSSRRASELQAVPFDPRENESSRRSSQLQAVPYEAEARESSRRASQLQTVPYEEEYTSSRRASQLQAVPYEPREAESSRRVSQLQAVPHASEDRRSSRRASELQAVPFDPRAAKPPRHLSIPEEDPSDESDCQKVMARTMSTECPPSRRQTRSSIDSQDLSFAMDAEQFDTWALQEVASSVEGDMVLSQTPRRGSVVSANRSLEADNHTTPVIHSREAVRSAASELGEVALSRKALEQEAITETYRQLASLNGEIGDAFLNLRYAWAPLHCEKVDGVA